MRSLLPLCLLLGLAAGCSRHEDTAPQPGETPAAVIGDDEASSLQAEADASLKAMNVATPSVGVPVLRTGLWEVTYQRPEMGFSETRHICVDDALAAKLAEMPANPDTVTCSRHEVRPDGQAVRVETVCSHNDTTLTSHIVIHSTGAEDFHQTMETVYDPAFAGHSDTHTLADGRRIGDCPAGMKPGETTVVGKG